METLFDNIDVSQFRFKKAEIGKFNDHYSDVALRGFKKQCRIMGLTRGRFSLIDLIHSVVKKTGKAHVICVTWSAGIKDGFQVKWLEHTNKISSFTMITDHSYKGRQRKYAYSLEKLFGKENIRTTKIHAKFVLIHNDDFKVCIRTSMNLNSNNTCENFEIDEDEDIFNFYFDFVENVVGGMPQGFTQDSFNVNRVLNKYFNNKDQNIRWWNRM